MSKRKCPFVSDFHTNPVKKQITGENGTTATVSQMKMIYDKTIRMLFVGANTEHEVHPTNNVQHEMMDQGVSRYYQTFLDSRCRLQSKHNELDQPRVQSNSFQLETSPSCSFCDKRLLNDQGKECSRCRETFCHLCSSESFNNFSDQFVCLGCG